MKLEKRKLRLKKDWVGAYVKARRPIFNYGGNAVSAGWVGQVKKNFRGLHIRFDLCKVCGTSMTLNGVSEHDIAYLGHEVKEIT